MLLNTTGVHGCRVSQRAVSVDGHFPILYDVGAHYQTAKGKTTPCKPRPDAVGTKTAKVVGTPS